MGDDIVAQYSTEELGEFARQAAHPQASPEFLADLAGRVPEVRALIADNPNAYPALLDWMAQFGDPAVLAAIARKTPAPVVIPTFETYASAQPTVEAVTPAPAFNPAFASYASAQPMVAAVSPRKSRRMPIVIVAASVVLLLVAGSIVGINAFLTGGFSSATKSAAAFPASTFAWAEFSIDPSADQKLGALKLIQGAPGFTNYLRDTATESDISPDLEAGDLKAAIWNYLSSAGSLDQISLDYERDIKPWLGSRIAVGSTPDGAVVAFESSNDSAGITAVETFVSEVGNADAVQVTSKNGFVIAASTDVDLDAAFAAGTLADTASMKSMSSKLGGWGLASGWYSPRAMYESHGESDPEVLALLPEDGAVGSVVRISDSSLEFVATTANLDLPAVAKASGLGLADAPASTMVAASASHLGSIIDTVYRADFLAFMNSSGYFPTDWVSSIEEQKASGYEAFGQFYGLNVPSDLDDLLGTDLTISLDRDLNCDVTTAFTGGCADPNAGITVRSDNPAATQQLWEQSTQSLNSMGAQTLSVQQVDGAVQVSVGSGSVAVAGPKLGDSATFKRALPDLDGASMAYYLDAAAVLDTVRTQLEASGQDATDIAYLDGISALGITVRQDDSGDLTLRARVSVSD